MDLEGPICLIDDIQIFGKTQEEHNATLIKVLEKLQTVSLTLDSSKSEFSQSQVKFLGQVINSPCKGLLLNLVPISHWWIINHTEVWSYHSQTTSYVSNVLGSSICKNALVLSESDYIPCTKVELSLP